MVTNLRHKITQTTPTEKKERTPNSTYKKLAVQWLNEALCIYQTLVGKESFVLLNRQLLVAAKRYKQA
jgi:hypothetical protein